MKQVKLPLYEEPVHVCVNGSFAERVKRHMVYRREWLTWHNVYVGAGREKTYFEE